MSDRTRKPPILFVDTPVMFEDDGQEEMGESIPHSTAAAILQYGLTAHFATRPGHYVCGDLNLHYHCTNRRAYVSPDVMVVCPVRALARTARSYRIGRDRPPPVFVAEVLSDRTAQQGDLSRKPTIYADVRVPEYLLFDPTGEHLAARLVLRVRAGNRRWEEAPGSGVAVVSRHGFTVTIEPDDQLRVTDTATGYRYPRPAEADAIARERDAANDRVRELEAELARLRGTPPPPDK